MTNYSDIADATYRKEFYWTKRWPETTQNIYKSIIPLFDTKSIIKYGNHLRLLGHQQFVSNFINPNTPFKRLHIKWSTGSGKTLAGIAIAMNFIETFRAKALSDNDNIGSVFVIGFSERQFRAELLRYLEFGFISREEQQQLEKLRNLAITGQQQEISAYTEMLSKVKSRMTNRQRNGFFRFYGYRAFVNKIFIDKDGNISNMDESQIRQAIEEKKIQINQDLLKEFRNSLIISDEIHNVYNSVEKNSWGIALQTVLDNEPTVRIVTMSATPLNHSPTEIIDLLNLLLPNKQLQKSDFFKSNNVDLKPGALQKIGELSEGHFSFLIDTDPKFYPRMIVEGEKIATIPYLKFIRCEMSPLQYKTVKNADADSMLQDMQYLTDFVLPNPHDANVGLFRSNDIKHIITSAPAKWKTEHGVDFHNGTITGTLLRYETIGKYSSKFHKLLTHIFAAIKEKHGKIFIYHSVVHVGGVMLIRELLINNGFLDEFSSPTGSTLCFHCGKMRSEHENVSGGNVDDVYFEAVGLFDNNPPTNADVLTAVAAWRVMCNGISHALITMISSQSEEFYYVDYLDTQEKILNKLANMDKALYLRINKNTQSALVNELVERNFVVAATNETSILFYKYANANGINLNTITGGTVSHTFAPVRFIMAHSEIDKRILDQSLEKYNSRDNMFGTNYMILIGSKIIKESYDLKAIQNVYIVGRPDNISAYIQIRGRAIRKNSHKDLPEENQIVRIKIFVSTIPGRKTLSYEESKYKEKTEMFSAIQEIEKVIHERSIDANINADKSIRNSASDPLGVLPFKPKYSIDKQLSDSQMIADTFDVYFAEKEINVVKYIIKRLFMDVSRIWEYEMLFDAVKNAPDTIESDINTRILSKRSFNIALSQLIWRAANNYVEPRQNIEKKGGADELAIFPVQHSESVKTDVNDDDVDDINSTFQDKVVSGGSVTQVDALFDMHNKIIYMHNNSQHVILPIINSGKQIYYLTAYDSINKKPIVDFEIFGRVHNPSFLSSININNFVQTKRVDFDYNEKKVIFIRKHSNLSIDAMENVICEYGSIFHIKFLEECIEYVFNVWTNPNQKRDVNHDFYFKMLYYYDLRSLVMFAYTSKPHIFEKYSKYAIPILSKDIKLKSIERYENRKKNGRDNAASKPEDIDGDDPNDIVSSGIINLLKTTYNRTSNIWVPQEFRDEYNEIIRRSNELFIGKSKKTSTVVKVKADLLPIGHYISQYPRVYHPETGWSEIAAYGDDIEFKENNIIIGFDERSETGVHTRFKLRAPVQNIAKHSDSRETEKGTVCESKRKEYLLDIAKKLHVDLDERVSVKELCGLIRSKLIRYELVEQKKKSRIRYFYMHWETQPI